MKQSVAWHDGFLYTHYGFKYTNVTEIAEDLTSQYKF